MRLRAERDALAKVVAQVGRVARPGPAGVALVHLTVEGDKVDVSATDLDVSMRTTMDVAGGEAGTVAVGAKTLSNALASLPVREPIEPAPVDLDAISDAEWAVRQMWPEDPETAVMVARCESGLRPDATGAAGEMGVMQLHPVHRARVEAMGYSWAQMHDLMPNLVVARAIWEDADGWGPWTCAA